jgi:hypothetical protein
MIVINFKNFLSVRKKIKSFFVNLRGKVSVYKHDEFDENGDPIELTFVKKQSNDDDTDEDDEEDDENDEDDKANSENIDRHVKKKKKKVTMTTTTATSTNEQNDKKKSPSMSSSSLKRSQRIRAKLGNYILSLGSGSGFGEMALVNDNPRNATIIAGK